MEIANLLTAILPNEAIAVIVYALDEYEPPELEMSQKFWFWYNMIRDTFNSAYIERKLDYSQFEARQGCPHCGKDLDYDNSS